MTDPGFTQVEYTVGVGDLQGHGLGDFLAFAGGVVTHQAAQFNFFVAQQPLELVVVDPFQNPVAAMLAGQLGGDAKIIDGSAVLDMQHAV